MTGCCLLYSEHQHNPCEEGSATLHHATAQVFQETASLYGVSPSACSFHLLTHTHTDTHTSQCYDSGSQLPAKTRKTLLSCLTVWQVFVVCWPTGIPTPEQLPDLHNDGFSGTAAVKKAAQKQAGNFKKECVIRRSGQTVVLNLHDLHQSAWSFNMSSHWAAAETFSYSVRDTMLPRLGPVHRRAWDV